MTERRLALPTHVAYAAARALLQMLQEQMHQHPKLSILVWTQVSLTPTEYYTVTLDTQLIAELEIARPEQDLPEVRHLGTRNVTISDRPIAAGEAVWRVHALPETFNNFINQFEIALRKHQ